jgi:hypothetical protein
MKSQGFEHSGPKFLQFKIGQAPRQTPIQSLSCCSQPTREVYCFKFAPAQASSIILKPGAQPLEFTRI